MELKTKKDIARNLCKNNKSLCNMGESINAKRSFANRSSNEGRPKKQALEL